MEFVNYFEEDISARYEIGLLNKGQTLKVSLHQDLADFLKDITSNKEAPILEIFKGLDTLPFNKFSPNEKSWGFGSVLGLLPSQRPDWLSWKCALPGGQEPDNTLWSKTISVSSTLSILSIIVDAFDGQTSSPDPQLFGLDLMVSKKFGGNSLKVELTRAWAEWVAKQEEGFCPAIQLPMQRAFEHMVNTKSVLNIFQAYFRDPYGVHLVVPGDACGLDPDQDYLFNSGYPDDIPVKGYSLLPHNVDSPVQQLSLLMGVAAMHDLTLMEKS